MFGRGYLLGIYLNDHLAGATVGVELGRRLAASHRDSPSGPDLARVAAEVGEDRDTLRDIMAALALPGNRLKVSAAWAAEKAARLKLNGHLLTRSPLSGLLELEAMRLGVEGKAAGWRTLRIVAETESRLEVRQLDTLLERARAQSDILEQVRTRAAAGLVDNS